MNLDTDTAVSRVEAFEVFTESFLSEAFYHNLRGGPCATWFFLPRVGARHRPSDLGLREAGNSAVGSRMIFIVDVINVPHSLDRIESVGFGLQILIFLSEVDLVFVESVS